MRSDDEPGLHGERHRQRRQLNVDPRTPVAQCCWPRCPQCGRAKRETYGREGRKRYHYCQRCRLAFKSVEIELPPIPPPPA